MSAVSFRNTGLIDLRSVRTFGVSAKENENPIGFFGTGLKYAIAICLRLGCTVTMWRGLDRYEFSTSEVAIRNGEFRIVTMNGEEIGFTTDLGKTWEPWQAYREVHCNTTDERGDILEGEVEPREGYTTFIVKGAPFYGAYLERAQIILTASPRWTFGHLEVHEHSSAYGYYRGIRATKLEKPSVMTYNVKSDLDLTEDRTLKNIYQFYSAVARAVLTSNDEGFIARFLQAPTGTLEASLDLDGWIDPSEPFLSTLEAVTFRHCTNNSALRVYKKHRKCVLVPDTTPLNRIEEIQLRRAVDFCRWANYRVDDYEIIVTADLEEHTWGRAYEGRIYLNRSAFQAGTKIVAGTLIEEYIHLKHKLHDESRDLQNHLVNALVSMCELARGEPL
jgi:hypothetical protein